MVGLVFVRTIILGDGLTKNLVWVLLSRLSQIPTDPTFVAMGVTLQWRPNHRYGNMHHLQLAVNSYGLTVKQVIREIIFINNHLLIDNL